MANEPAVATVAAALYEAALQPEAWPTALSQLGAMIGGTWSVLGALRRDDRSHFVTQDSAGDAEHFMLFSTRYNDAQTNPSIPTLIAAGQGAIIVRERVLSDRAWRRCGLYRDIYRPSGLYHALGACVLKTRSHLSFVGINRPERGGPYTDRELGRLQQALPHLQRAVEVLLRLAEAGASTDAHESVWDTLACGVVLVDDTGKVLWSNRAAGAVFERRDGLTVRSGRLAATRASENAALLSLVHGAIRMSRGLALSAGGALSVSRRLPLRPLALLVSPIQAGPTFVRRPAAVVFVTDPEREPEPAAELLMRLYGLTAREAALATLVMRGMNLHEAAGQLAISIHTARTYLRFIFRKTGTRRQGELIGMLLRGPAGLR